jgi:hypothetical protein
MIILLPVSPVLPLKGEILQNVQSESERLSLEQFNIETSNFLLRSKSHLRLSSLFQKSQTGRDRKKPIISSLFDKKGPLRGSITELF